MNILILGSGGREHALAWKISQSPLLKKIYVAPGNAGTEKLGTNLKVNPNDFRAVKNAVLEHQINLVVVGPEEPLVKGIYDYFKQDVDLQQVKLIGPSQQGAQLEGSKDFAKIFMQKHQIPTAAYQTFSTKELAKAYLFLETLKPPFVLKADGLAAGKGVLILDNLETARKELKAMLQEQKFGEASSKVVIEEYLKGIEMSCFVYTDGHDYTMLPNAKDYKRIGENDTGLNTGGMGAVSPVPFADKVLLKKIENKVIRPSIQGLKKDQIDYIGFVFFGLMIVHNEPYVIEYNVRLGDPEAEVILPRINSDLLALFTAEKSADLPISIKPDFATTVMTVSGGYPRSYEKAKPITGLDTVSDSIVFHAGTKMENNQVLTDGGRVLAFTSLGATMQEALKKSYNSLKKVHFDQMNYRRDIGFDLS